MAGEGLGDDGDPCNGVASCDPLLAAVADHAACGPGTPLVCDDGRFCNGTESCAPGTGCVPGPPPVCDPGDAADPCDGVWGCDEERRCHEVAAPPECDVRVALSFLLPPILTDC